MNIFGFQLIDSLAELTFASDKIRKKNCDAMQEHFANRYSISSSSRKSFIKNSFGLLFDFIVFLFVLSSHWTVNLLAKLRKGSMDRNLWGPFAYTFLHAR